jgi:hypothetical protein
MTPEEYAQQWAADLTVADMTRERSQQTQQRVLGVSDIMHCRSYAARFLNGDPFTDGGVSHQALRGTWIHQAVLPTIADASDGRVEEQPVEVTLPNGFVVKGHADLIDIPEPSVTDLKTVDGLAGVKRHGATPQQKMQRHLYGAGARSFFRSGTPASDITVRNVWMDTNNLLAPPHVEQEPYDPSYLDTAAAWIDEVQYHVDQGLVDDAPKDKDWFFCETFCPFFTACRGGNRPATDEVIQSDELAVAAAQQREAIDLENEAKELRKAARQVLERVQDAKVIVEGEAGRFRVASTWVNPTSYEVNREGGYRTTIKEA